MASKQPLGGESVSFAWPESSNQIWSRDELGCEIFTAKYFHSVSRYWFEVVNSETAPHSVNRKDAIILNVHPVGEKTIAGQLRGIRYNHFWKKRKEE
jgi:hypothetical protein